MIILTGPVQKGKSTALGLWARTRSDVGGFYCPIIEGKRKLLHIPSRKIISFEAEGLNSEEKLVQVGRFSFLHSAFNEATAWLREDHKNPELKYIVIDEIGKLEINDKGFNDVLVDLISKDEARLIILVRDTLLDQVVRKYSIDNPLIIEKDELFKL